jgi:4-hydroxybenzoate polyprenyltransferase
VALLAGASPAAASRLGLAMTALQLGIGALNDVVDAPRDAGRKPGKPIPAGLVGHRAGGLIAVVAFALGFLLAATAGPIATGLALVVIAIGLAYDLWLKGTAWSWLPFAVGIPILPIFGWAATTGDLDPIFLVLVSAAIAGGAALAIANSLVDVERDRAAKVSSVAVALGERRAGTITIVLLAAIAAAAVGSAWAFGGDLPMTLIVGSMGCLPVMAATLARSSNAARRELAWRVEATGLGILAVAWIRAVVT